MNLSAQSREWTSTPPGNFLPLPVISVILACWPACPQLPLSPGNRWLTSCYYTFIEFSRILYELNHTFCTPPFFFFFFSGFFPSGLMFGDSRMLCCLPGSFLLILPLATCLSVGRELVIYYQFLPSLLPPFRHLFAIVSLYSQEYQRATRALALLFMFLFSPPTPPF